jgi:thiosulfate/3-mercaptopyruvate sulfurtransferase
MNNDVPFDELVTTAQLFAHLDDPRWVVFDCRFDLANPSWGREEYRKAHIPGAIYAHLNEDLSAPVKPDTGRHPLPEIDVIVQRFSAWGVSAEKQVVVYDSGGGATAARLWWMLHYLGHPAAAVLDGGYAKWSVEGRPMISAMLEPSPAQFTPHPNPSMLVDVQTVERLLHDPDYKIVDARAPIRYRGESEPIDPIAGRIPGAVNRFHENNLTSGNTLRPRDELRRAFLDLLGETPAERAVVYCGSGVTSCHHVLAMRLAGLGTPGLYVGSWSEWIRDPSRPIARG